ncbi:hypothetical protein D9M70_634890 [compost metagenome]
MASQRQQLACRLSSVVEHQFELAKGFFSGLLATLPEYTFGLHMKDGKTQQHREQSTQQGHGDPHAALAGFGFQWHSRNLYQ